MLVINPDECIDCGVCEPNAWLRQLSPDTNLGGEETDWVALNAKYPEILSTSGMKEPPPDADKFNFQWVTVVPNKLSELSEETLEKVMYKIMYSSMDDPFCNSHVLKVLKKH